MHILRYCDGTELDYTRIRSLSFAQEMDLTLATIPINEFTAEIVTSDDIAVGDAVDLLDDMDNLWASFYVMKSERVRHDIVRVLAQSPLALMDKWTLAAETIGPMSFQAFLGRIFSDTPVSGVKHTLTYELDAFYTFKDYLVYAFCPEQTARERLQWLCLYIGATVKQGYSGVLRIVPSPYVDPDAKAAKGTLIPISDTYWRPKVETRDPVGSVSITLYTSPSQTEDPQDDMQSEDGSGVTWYYASRRAVWDNASEEGTRADVDGVTLLNAMQYDNHPEVFTGLVEAYYTRREIHLEVINNFRYQPGQKVRVYADPETIYEGIIRSCDYTFGNQAKSRLVVCTGLEPLPVGKLIILHKYGDDVIGRQEYVLPEGEEYSITNPEVTWYPPGAQPGDGPVTYEPETSTTEGTVPEGGGDIEVPVSYGPDVPVSIRLAAPPDNVIYNDGDNIDYTGLRVIVYDKNNRPWTNEGRYPGGVIVPGDLILNVRRAELASADITNREAWSDGVTYHANAGTEAAVWPTENIPPAPAAQEERYQVDSGDGPFYTFGHTWGDDGGGRGAFICSPNPFKARINDGATRYSAYTYTKPKTSLTVYYYGRDAYQSYFAPETDQPLNAGDVRNIAWALCFGEYAETGLQSIPVYWIRPSDGAWLDTDFGIIVKGRTSQDGEG